MALPVFQRTIVTEAGDVIAGAEVEVVNEATGLAADIFSDRAGNTARTNPFFTGADGFAKFFAAPAEYRITATGPTGSIVFRFVVLTGDIARQDANAVAITGGSASLAANGLTVGTDQLVTSGGNVGIGTSSPTAKLDVLTAGGFSVGRFGNGTSQVGIGVSTDNTTFIEVPQAQPLRFLTSGIEHMRIGASGSMILFTGDFLTTSADGLIGSVGTFNTTTSAGANVHILSNGFMLRSVSSIKYKRDVQDATHGLVGVMALRPVTYKSKNAMDGESVVGGLIAEEVHEAGLTEFVQYAEDGTPDALAYGNMVSLAFKAIQELKAINDAQAQTIESLTARVVALEQA